MSERIESIQSDKRCSQQSFSSTKIRNLVVTSAIHYLFFPPISISISSHCLSFLFTLFALLFYHSVIAPFLSSSSLLPLPLFLPLSLSLLSLSLHLTLSLSPFLPPFLPSLFLLPFLSLHFSLTPFLPPAHISFLNFSSLPPSLLFSSHRQRRLD